MKKKKLAIFLVFVLSLSMLLSSCDFGIDLSGTSDPSKTEKKDDNKDDKLVNLGSFYNVLENAYEPYERTINEFETEDFFQAVAFTYVNLAGASLAFGAMYDATNPDNKDGTFEGSLLGTITRKLEKDGKDITFGYENIAEEDATFGDIKKGDINIESGVADLESGYIKYESTTQRGDDIIKRDYEEAYVISKNEIVITGCYGRLVRENATKDTMYFSRITKDVLSFVIIEGIFGTDYEFLPLDKDTTADDIKQYCEDNGLEISISGKIVGETVTLD